MLELITAIGNSFVQTALLSAVLAGILIAGIIIRDKI